MPYKRLHGRMDRLRGELRHRPRSAIDWSLLTDAELERLEPIARQVIANPDVATALATLAPADRAWVTALATSLDRRER